MTCDTEAAMCAHMKSNLSAASTRSTEPARPAFFCDEWPAAHWMSATILSAALQGCHLDMPVIRTTWYAEPIVESNLLPN
jgi:hypothetical protein